MKTARCLHIAFAFILSSPVLMEAQQHNKQIPPVVRGIAQHGKVPEKAWATAKSKGIVRVIVTLNVTEELEGKLSREAKEAQRQAIAAGQDALISELQGTKHRVLGKGRTGNFVILEVASDALAVLERSSLVKKVVVDRGSRWSLAESVPIVRAPQAWAVGYDGSGWAVAIIDTGVQSDHPFLENKVIVEACFSINSNCPLGGIEEVGVGSAAPCTYASVCSHGTHVAGIAAGVGETFSGVAKGAVIIAIQISSRASGEQECGPPPNEDPCSIPFLADQLKALDYVNLLADFFDVASVTMSLGDDTYSDQQYCDAVESERKQRIDALREKKSLLFFLLEMRKRQAKSMHRLVYHQLSASEPHGQSKTKRRSLCFQTALPFFPSWHQVSISTLQFQAVDLMKKSAHRTLYLMWLVLGLY